MAEKAGWNSTAHRCPAGAQRSSCRHFPVSSHTRSQQKALRRQIKETGQQRKQARADAKAEMDRHAFFARAAKPVLDAEKLLSQRDMYAHLDEIMAKADALEQAKEQVPAE